MPMIDKTESHLAVLNYILDYNKHLTHTLETILDSKTDAQAARTLGVTRQAVYSIRKTHKEFFDKVDKVDKVSKGDDE